MNLVERAKNMILTPASEWEVVSQEPTTIADLYKTYIAPLAAIAPIAGFIGVSIVGISIPFIGTTRVSILSGLSMALVQYAFTLVGVFLLSLLIDALAPTFGGEKDPMRAFKLAAFSYTPAWVAGVLHILPALGILAILAGFYSLYVLYLGLPVLMRAPKDKAVGYTVAVVVCAIVLAVVFQSLSSMVGGFGVASPFSARRGDVSITPSTDAGAALEKLKQMGVNMDAANKKMEAAKQSGNPQAQVDAAGAALGTLMGGGGAPVDTVDQNLLKAMLPETLANLKRNKLEAEKAGLGGFKISKAQAGYGDDQGHSVDITITDAGGTAVFGALAAWALVEQEKETDSGYEKMGKVNGRPVHEQFNKNDKSGEYSVVVASRFVVEAKGRQVDMDMLKAAVASIGLDKLEALKGAGVKQ